MIKKNEDIRVASRGAIFFDRSGPDVGMKRRVLPMNL